MKKIFLGVYNPSIILTYISVFCSLYGIGNLMLQYTSDPFKSLKLSMILLIIAGVCDMFDGKVARLCKRTNREKEFGIQLDSLADTVSFVVFPAVILMCSTQMHIVSIILSMFYVFAGIMRLGWFNVTTEENKGFFYGLPVTFSALILPITFLILTLFNIPFQNTIFHSIFALTGIAFILNFKIKKPGLIFSIIMLFMAIAATIGLVLMK